jgi:hypothetical protein
MESDMIRRLVPALAFTVLLTGTGATFAAPFCDGSTEGLSFSFSVGGRVSEDDRNTFDLMHLRQMGVDATRVERWNGCIRAFVRKPGGGEEMQFFEPGSYRPVYSR